MLGFFTQNWNPPQKAHFRWEKYGLFLDEKQTELQSSLESKLRPCDYTEPHSLIAHAAFINLSQQPVAMHRPPTYCKSCYGQVALAFRAIYPAPLFQVLSSFYNLDIHLFQFRFHYRKTWTGKQSTEKLKLVKMETFSGCKFGNSVINPLGILHVYS